MLSPRSMAWIGTDSHLTEIGPKVEPMTSEIALLNRSAVALAADSAVTVTYWENGETKTRYLKGANKLFHISNSCPVGMMIFASADLQGVPWELLAKAFRDELGDHRCKRLAEYAPTFFDYITNNKILFAPEIQEKQFKSDVILVGMRILFELFTDDFRNEADTTKKRGLTTAALQRVAGEIEGAKFVGNVVQADIDSAIANHLDTMRAEFAANKFFASFEATVDLAELAVQAIRGLFKVGRTALTESGIVFAGYGEDEFFPRLCAYDCYGLVLGKLIVLENENKAIEISQENSSAIVPFAQDEMIRTFMYGVSMTGLRRLDADFKKGIALFEEELKKADKLPKAEDLSDLVSQASSVFSRSVLDHFLETHSTPLRRAVGMLSVGELAELAETLVSLESVKERVTRPSDSVSGPIDVAVISKSDGFIWIKRKHYFDPETNPRFFARKGLPK